MDIDVAGLERVGGTPAGAYYEVEPGIVLALPFDGYIQTVEDARRSLLENYRIAKERGPHVIVVLVDRVRSQDSASRRVWTQDADPQRMIGLALVGNTPLGRAIASFFIGLTRPRVPTAMFASLDEAVVWARGLHTDRAGHD